MRYHILGLALMAGVAMPAMAQRAETLDKKVDRIEQELRAVQRRVFPNATSPYVAGEIQNAPTAPSPVGVPATSAVADLTARVDALETQLRTMTNQAEENANRLRLLEQGIAQLRAEHSARLDALERGGAGPAGSSGSDDGEAQPAAQPPARTLPSSPSRRTASETEPRPAPSQPAPTPAAADPDAEAEAAYNAGFRLWDQKKYAEAQQALLQVAKKYPNSKWASWANNLAGRAYLDDGKPVQAARILLANYQTNPKGERAADSLFYVGRALMDVGKPEAACKAYDELQDVYGRSLRAEIRQRLPGARAEAKCK